MGFFSLHCFSCALRLLGLACPFLQRPCLDQLTAQRCPERFWLTLRVGPPPGLEILFILPSLLPPTFLLPSRQTCPDLCCDCGLSRPVGPLSCSPCESPNTPTFLISIFSPIQTMPEDFPLDAFQVILGSFFPSLSSPVTLPLFSLSFDFFFPDLVP